MKLSVPPFISSKILLSFLVCVYLSCACNSGQSKSVKSIESGSVSRKSFKLESPASDQIFSYTDSIPFEVAAPKSIHIDSVCLFSDGELMHTEKINPLSFSKQGIFEQVGRQNVRVRIYYDDSLSHSLSRRLILFSDREPEKLSCRVIAKLPHNTSDFTQGLFYYNGYLYEGTGSPEGIGRPKYSRLIKTIPESGEVIIERKLDSKFFGEGITRVDDEIFQITYQHKVGFVYDIESFEQIREFDLQTMEGWGLCYDGKDLIMSDGSSYLYFYDPESITQNKQLDVAHNKGLVNNLNELEFQDGAIWANVYGRSVIIKIDANSGIVLAQLDLDYLFPKNTPRDYDHVLNGIAYNSDHDSYYVTGKYWPVIYEIKISE